MAIFGIACFLLLVGTGLFCWLLALFIKHDSTSYDNAFVWNQNNHNKH